MSGDRKITIDKLALLMFGITRTDALEQGICVCCKAKHEGRVMLQTALCAGCLDESLNGPPEGEKEELMSASIKIAEIGEA